MSFGLDTTMAQIKDDSADEQSVRDALEMFDLIQQMTLSHPNVSPRS